EPGAAGGRSDDGDPPPVSCCPAADSLSPSADHPSSKEASSPCL
ncbi:MAG: hypothetical protein AVDCRST_MAG19-821, partial [uncultured Thermomicrobiales bacterium]